MARLIRLFLIFMFIGLLFGCGHVSLVPTDRLAQVDERMVRLEGQVADLATMYEELIMGQDVAAGGNFFWRNCLQGGGECLDGVTGYVDGDGALVVFDDGGTYKFLAYRFESSSASGEDAPAIIVPDDAGGGEWLQLEFYVKTVATTQGTSPGSIKLYEGSAGGTDYSELTTQTALASTETFDLGKWRTETWNGDAIRTLTIEETKTIFQLDLSNLSTDRVWTLPEGSTANGCEYIFFIYIGTGDIDEFRIDPADGTDKIIGTDAAGHYIWVNGTDYWLHLKQVGDDRWTIVNMVDVSTPTFPSGWTKQ